MTLSANRIATPQSASQHAESRFIQVQDPLNRAQVEHFIRRHFHRLYGALIDDFRPHSIALLNPRQQLTAAFDYQPASEQPLLLEQFLNAPAEEMIAQKGSITAPPRQSIVELGNLAADCEATIRRLVLGLAAHFHQLGVRWLLITATPKMLQSFHQLGVDRAIHTLARAEPARASLSRFSWGSYFEQGPGIYAVDINRGLATLAHNPIIARLISQSRAPESDQQLTIYQREAWR
ncbi:thermostable hemolysin [Marinobacterium jannaschii]|uniref:thermostable hemolysin n=1 Tax=Marinobacterium jannaschii TaxID=64970 RepID=UPI000488218E|nr:thermostable hemolysin [Marinobacterium jannaschii]